MKIDQKGIDFLIEVEGLRTRSYKDTAGKLTIGYGHLMTPVDLRTLERKVDKKGDVYYYISKEKAEQFLKQDVEWAEKIVHNYIKNLHETSQDQYNALVSFTYNLGTKAFRNIDGTETKICLYHNRGAFKSASSQFIRFSNSGGKWDKGVYNRRVKETQFYLGER
ncbi:lysozyme [Caudoviricetes sp.]|nr:lysozyme [Caudoviricetes sp.]